MGVDRPPVDAMAVAVRLGPQIDEGSFIAATSAPVSFDKIENPTVTTDDQEGATVSGTIGNDAIAVVARDASTHAGTNGNRDFTVALSDGRDVLSRRHTPPACP